MKSNTLKILTIMLFFIFIVSKNVYADNTNTANLSFAPSKTSIKPGESITYEVKVSNINAGTGIKAVDFYVDYDANSFDCKVDPDDNRNWSVTSFLRGYLTMEKSDYNVTTQDQSIAKITFTAKTGITAKTYPASFKHILFTTETGTFEIADKSVDISVVSEQTGGTTTGGSTTGGTTTGGSTTGGTTTGGSTTGGTTTGGSTTGGTTTGGNTTGGTTTGGSTTGGTTTGGSTTGGTTTGGNTTSGGNSTGTQTTTNQSSSKSSTSSSTTKKTTSGSNSKSASTERNLPYSGDGETIAIILGIIVLSSLSIWWFIRYKKINL